MEIEPPNLNIPLEHKEHWGLLLVVVCIVVTAIAALFSPSFAKAFAASSIVGLPSVAGSDYYAPNDGFCPRGRNRLCSSLALFRSNSHLADSILLALSPAIA
jgi:hypothetical protein